MPFYDAIRIGSSAVSDTAFTVDRSLRFNDDDTAYLYRTQGTPTSDKIGTYSTWFKLANLGIDRRLRMSFTNGSNYGYLRLHSDNTLQFYVVYGGSVVASMITTQVFRDVSAWYHVVLAVDTTQATASDRVKIYVNGIQITSFSTETYFSQNQVNSMFSASGSNQSTVGSAENATVRWDGYLAEVNNIDGQQLTPSSFGETDATTGQWIPKDTSGLTFGTNGFRLQFGDNSGTTATTLGKDTSGNSNNFTPSGFSVTAGVGNDSLEDTPTNNFPTLNPLYNPVNSTLSEGNLLARGGDNFAGSTFLLPKNGKWYVEFSKYGNGALQSISVTRANTAMTNYAGYLGLADNVEYVSNGELGNRSRGSTSDATAWTSDADIVVAAAVDMDNGAVYFARANTWQNSGDPTSGSSKTGAIATDLLTDNNGDHIIAVHGYNGNINYGMYANFGQRPFTYTPPTGYKSLCSANLPDPTILFPNKHFDTIIYSGDGNSTQTLSDVLQFQPDFFWSKARNVAYSHLLYDSVRGAGTLKALNSNDTRIESGAFDNSTYGFLTSFDANGFTVTKGTDSSSYTNGASSNYVAWNWNAGGTDSKTYKVKVVADSTDYGHGTGSNKYQFFKSDGTTGFGTNAVDLDLEEGGTYVFDWSDSSAQSHPLRFSLTNDGTHSNGTSAGTEYTTGVTKDDSAYKTTITIASGVANLFYYCQNHSGMGAEINTNTTKGSTNFDGSIQTTVKANTTAGFSIVTYTSPNNSSDQTVGHGLGVKPSFIIVKNRDATFNWDIYHSSLGYNASLIFTTASTRSGAFGAEPTSTVYTTKNNYTHASTNKYVAYVFSDVSSFSKIGSYVGNGNSDGPFVFTNFRPSFILTKRSDGTTPWRLFDNKRPNANFQTYKLEADSSGTELTGYPYADFLGNGFKIRDNGSYQNANGGNYVYLCFAESPFKNARAR